MNEESPFPVPKPLPRQLSAKKMYPTLDLSIVNGFGKKKSHVKTWKTETR